MLSLSLPQLQIQEQNEIDDLRRKLQDLSQLHEATRNELQSLKIKHKDILSEKVLFRYGIRT